MLSVIDIDRVSKTKHIFANDGQLLASNTADQKWFLLILYEKFYQQSMKP